MLRIYAIILLLCLAQAHLLARGTEARITHFSVSDGFTESYVTGVLQDSEGFIWVSSWNGLSRYDGYRFQTFKGRPGDHCPLEINRITGIAELPDHNIVCVSNFRYYIFNRHTLTFKAVANKGYKRLIGCRRLPDKTSEAMVRALPQYRNIEVKFLCRDRQGGVWVQSNRGLERVRWVRKPIAPEKYGSEGEESVRGLYRDHNGRVWIADKNGVVRVLPSFKPGVPVLSQPALFLTRDGRLSVAPAVFGRNVYTFCEDRAGCLWLGAKPDGLFRLRPTEGGYMVSQFVNNPADKWSLSDNSVYDIVSAPDGRLFVATFNGGLNIVEPSAGGGERFVNIHNLLRGYPRIAIQSRCLLLMPGGTLLIGTADGLVACRTNVAPEQMKFFVNRRDPDAEWSLGNNYVVGLLLTRQGRVLLATSGGGMDLVASHNLLTDRMHFYHFTSREGLSSDMTQALVEDPSDHVWVVAEASLSRIDVDKKESVNYAGGFLSGRFAFTEAKPLCFPGGQIVAGTTQGTLSFGSLTAAKSSFVPPIVFNCDSVVEVTPEEKSFNVEFAALDYNKNDDIVYAYRLDGIDRDWQYTTSRELHYVNLEPGNYRLHVRSTNGDGVWTDNERTISIHRRAAFTETPYFWMLIGLLLAVTAYIIYNVVAYIRRLQREIKDIQLTSEEKIALLADRVRQLLAINESVEKVDTAEDGLTADDHRMAERVKECIEANIGNSEFQVQDLAEAVGVSRTVLFTRMKRIFHSSPNNLMLNMRIDRARQLLSAGNVQVSEVAYSCGFSDPKYFSRCFKKLTGKNPTEWLK